MKLLDRLHPGKTVAACSSSALSRGLDFSHHHLMAFALIFGSLGVVLLWQSFGAPAPFIATVEAENMILPSGASLITSNSASNGRAVKMLQTGTATFTGALNADTAKLTIRAYGVKCAEIWPKIVVGIDDKTVYSVDINGYSWTDFEKDLAVTKGTHKLSITFANGGSTSGTTLGAGNSGCQRALYLDKVTFYGQPSDPLPPPPPPAPPASPTLNFSANPSSVPSSGSATLTW